MNKPKETICPEDTYMYKFSFPYYGILLICCTLIFVPRDIHKYHRLHSTLVYISHPLPNSSCSSALRLLAFDYAQPFGKNTLTKRKNYISKVAKGIEKSRVMLWFLILSGRNLAPSLLSDCSRKYQRWLGAWLVQCGNIVNNRFGNIVHIERNVIVEISPWTFRSILVCLSGRVDWELYAIESFSYILIWERGYARQKGVIEIPCGPDGFILNCVIELTRVALNAERTSV